MMKPSKEEADDHSQELVTGGGQSRLGEMAGITIVQLKKTVLWSVP